jgi:hypothetical protein
MKYHPAFVCLLIVLLVLSVAINCAAGDSTGAIKGKVTDEKDKELWGAKVVVDSVGKPTSMQANTDSAGNFEIPDIQPGMYEIRASFARLQNLTYKIVFVKANKATFVIVVLHPVRRGKPAYFGPSKHKHSK